MIKMTLKKFDETYPDAEFIDMWYYLEDKEFMSDMIDGFDYNKCDIYFDGETLFYIKNTKLDLDDSPIDYDDVFNIMAVKPTEYQKEQLLMHDKIRVVSMLNKLIKDVDVQFVIGASYHHINHCGIVEGRVVISQNELPTRI